MFSSGTRTGGMATRVNQSFHSRGSVRSVAPTSVACRTMSSGEWLNRKLWSTSATTSPFSTR